MNKYRATSISLCSFALVLISLEIAFGDWEGELKSAHFLSLFSARDRKIAEEMIRIAERAYGRITADIGVEPEGRIRIYVCGTRAEFKRLVGSSIRGWAAAVAIPSARAMVVMAPRALEGSHPEDIGRTITHELTHVVVGILLGERAGDIPTWMHEGIATYEAKEWGLGWSWILGGAAIAGRLIPLKDLSHMFPEGRSDAFLAYAQSYSAISYIVKKFGPEAIKGILTRVREGISFDEAFTKAVGLSLGEFEGIWRSYVRRYYTFITVFTSSAMFWFMVSILFLMAYLAKKRKERERMRRWEMEELLYPGGYGMEDERDVVERNELQGGERM